MRSEWVRAGVCFFEYKGFFLELVFFVFYRDVVETLWGDLLIFFSS